MKEEIIEIPKGSGWISFAAILFFISFTFFLFGSDTESASNLSEKKVLLTKRYWKSEYNSKSTKHWLELAFTDFQQNMTIESYSDLKIADFKKEIGDYDSVTIKYQGNLIYSLSKNGKEYIEQDTIGRNPKALLFWGLSISLICIVVGLIKSKE